MTARGGFRWWLAAVFAVATPSLAGANDPLDEPEFDSYPKAGATDVPANLEQLWVYVGPGWTSEVSLEGEDLATSEEHETGWSIFALPPLPPLATYEYTVRATPIAGGSAVDLGPFEFTLSSVDADPVGPPVVDGLERRYTSAGQGHCQPVGPTDGDVCADAITAQNCQAYDQHLEIVADISTPDAVLYTVRPANRGAPNVLATTCSVVAFVGDPPFVCERNVCLHFTTVGADDVAPVSTGQVLRGTNHVETPYSTRTRGAWKAAPLHA